MNGQSAAPDFAGIHKSLVLPGRNDREQTYPTRSDYLDHLVREGYARDEADFAARPSLVVAVHQHWHALAQQGCRFAAFLSTRPVEHGWGRVVVPGEPGWDDELWGQISRVVATAIRSPAVQALSLIFPGVTSEEQLVRTLLELEGRLDWRLLPLPEPEGGWRAPVPVVGLALRVPLNRTVFSWPVGLGPFEFLPFTRRSPLTEVALVTKPRRNPPRSARIKGAPDAAHLADMPVNVEDAVFEKLWVNTERHKEFVLGDGGDPRAKAKVTFAVPARLWKREPDEQ
jgi:hypothetical protein